MSTIDSIAVIGLGKVGLPMALVFAAKGFNVKGYDILPERRRQLRQHGPTAFELRYENRLDQIYAQAACRFSVCDDLASAIKETSFSFVIVPTPSSRSGDFLPDQVVHAVRDIGLMLSSQSCPHVVVVVSTVSPGTMRGQVHPALMSALGQRSVDVPGLCYAPTLIALGDVVSGLLAPDFSFIGEFDPSCADRLQLLFKQLLPSGTPIHRMSVESVEIAKLALNNFLTMKIGFANMIGQLCSRTEGADASAVLNALGSDRRIGHRFLSAGLGFGGPCLPRDTVALEETLRSAGLPSTLPHEIGSLNRSHVQVLIQLLGNVESKSVAVAGLGYKSQSPFTDQSFPIALCNALVHTGARVFAVDPLSKEMDLRLLSEDVTVVSSLKDFSVLPSILLATGFVLSGEETAMLSQAGVSIFDIAGNNSSLDLPSILRFGKGKIGEM